MVQDLLIIAKYSILFIGSIYGYIRLSKIKLHAINLLDILAAVFLAAGLYYATKYVRILVPLVYLLLTYLYSLLRFKKSFSNTVTTGLIACGITIITMVIALVVSVPLDYLFFKYISDETTRNNVTIVIIGVLQVIIIFLFYKIKRFKSGISLQNNDGSIEVLLLLGVFSIFLMTLFYAKNIAESFTEIIIIAIVFCGLAFIVWWRKHIFSTYQQQLFKRNELLYEQRIQGYEKERNKLIHQNNELSKIIHRDNKLIPTILIVVNELLSASPHNQNLKSLLSQIEDLSAERSNIIETYQAQSDNLPKTEILAFDAVLFYIHTKTQQNHIDLSININKASIQTLLDRIPNLTDLSTILCDLGDNAIIATQNIEHGKICITFDLSEENIPFICFYDNGLPFDDKVLSNMGRKRITTHKAEGGSGIGLMTLFEILNKYNASYYLNEQPNETDYTKYIKISFDNQHTINIITFENKFSA